MQRQSSPGGGGVDGRAGRAGGELGLHAVLTLLDVLERVPFGRIFYLLLSLTQDMNCKMSNYLMKINPELAKCGQRL